MKKRTGEEPASISLRFEIDEPLIVLILLLIKQIFTEKIYAKI